ncbi:MAG TPA: translocation/assembly module TamB domain-containing protein [Candidatus Cybelea sp.]|jgi:hypothetical protein
MKQKRGRIFAGTAIVLLAVVALGLWQWERIARAIIVNAVASFANVHVSFGDMRLRWSSASFDNVVVTSFHDEPIATIARLFITYQLRDLLPGGKRLFGLTGLTVDGPHVTIVRYPDGSFNLPIPQAPANRAAQQRPLIIEAQVRDGSIDVHNQSSSAPANQRLLLAREITADADISQATRSTYSVSLNYGEQPGKLYPVRGRGDINLTGGYIDNHWTAAHLPVAAAVNFFINSPALRVEAAMLRNADVRYYALPDPSNKLQPHLAAGAALAGGRVAVEGLDVPVEQLSGAFDASDSGLFTKNLTATLAGTRTAVTGGVYDLHRPRLRVVVRGSGNLSRLRKAFTQARTLPMHGPLAFSLLVQGLATKPVIWMDLQSPGVTYAGTPIDGLAGFAAFYGGEADVVDFTGSYHGIALGARGRVALQKRPNAIQLLANVHAPAGTIPYVNQLLPQLPLNGVALAIASDPRAIALRGLVWGANVNQQADAVFDVDQRGVGSIGPLHLRDGTASLYARAALDRPHSLVAGLARVNGFRLPQAHTTLSATLFGGQSNTTYALTGIAGASTAWGSATAQARIAMLAGELHGGVSGRAGGQASFVASVAGKPQRPRLTGSVVVAGGRYRNFDVNGAAAMAFAGDTLHLHDAAVALGPLFVAASGSVTNLLGHGTFAPHYELATEMHSSDVQSLLVALQPRAAQLVQGSVDAKLAVHGTGMHPSFAGTVSAPEGLINGLAFRDFQGTVAGSTNAVAINDGRVAVGSTDLALSGGATTRGIIDVSVRAPHADLADFNDFFDRGDTLAGTGSVDLTAGLRGRQLLASVGDISLRGAQYRQLALGDVAADWHSAGGAINTHMSLGGPTGTIRASGSITPSEMSADMTAQVRSIDLATWLPMLGYHFSVTGHLDADGSLSGHYPDISMSVHAAVANGTAGHLPVQRFEVTAAATHGRGTIRSAAVELPSLAATASGTFGLRASDPLALVAHITSPNVGDFLKKATERDYKLTGTLASTVHVNGTLERPRVSAETTLASVQTNNVTIPRIYGVVEADRHSVALRNGEMDFANGRALLAAEAPIVFNRTGVAVGAGGISGSVTAEGIELSNFAQLLPKDTQLAGRIDGNVVASGSIGAPQLNGTLVLRDAKFSGPMEKSPITGIEAELAFAGNHATLESHAAVGGGTLTANGAATVANLRDPLGAAFNLEARAENARFDLPNYFTGVIDGSIALTGGTVADAPQVTGDVSISRARIPLNAFLSANHGENPRPSFPNIAFSNLRITAGNDVRVQNRSVDIGAVGELAFNGTLQSPSLDGSFTSTGGSINFLNQFNLESGKVTFTPTRGFIPDVNAVATTFVSNPPTAIRLEVRGPATNMNLELASDPSYSREQILGLLVGAQNFGAVQGINTNGNGGFSATGVAQQVALGQLNTMFTRSLLEPFTSSVGGALGFNEFAITTNIQTGVGVSATKRLGPKTNAIFSQTFGFPRTQSLTIEHRPSDGTAYRFNWYTTVGPTLFVLQSSQPAAVDPLNLNRATQLPPATGVNGINLQYLKKFPLPRLPVPTLPVPTEPTPTVPK